jgi:hypothetical protein
MADILFSLIQSPIVIIGMHRSGTTMLSQILEKAGVFMGADFTAYHESNYFQQLNEKLLQHQLGTWDKPKVTQSAPLLHSRYFISEYTSLKNKPYNIVQLLTRKQWGWKDPRTTYTLGSWIKIFPDIKVIHIVRNGIDTAISLCERNNMVQPNTKWHSNRLIKPESCFDLWEEYVNQARSWKENIGKNYIEVKYEEILAVERESILKIEALISKKVNKAAKIISDKERNIKEYNPAYDSLREYAKHNITFAKLGYVVEG